MDAFSLLACLNQFSWQGFWQPLGREGKGHTSRDDKSEILWGYHTSLGFAISRVSLYERKIDFCFFSFFVIILCICSYI